jgi:hypothetical protein
MTHRVSVTATATHHIRMQIHQRHTIMSHIAQYLVTYLKAVWHVHHWQRSIRILQKQQR